MGFKDIFGDNKLEVIEKKVTEIDNRDKENHECSIGEISKVKMDMHELSVRYEKKMLIMAESVQKLQEELKQYMDSESKNSTSTVPGNMSYTDVVKNVNIPNFNSTALKFYLFELGLLDMKINKERNLYSVKTNIMDINANISNLIDFKNGILSFKPLFTDYLETHKKEVSESISRYYAKNRQYKNSKINLESKNVKNYQAEIGRICGTKDKFDSSKWGEIYKIFAERYNNFEKSCSEYREENSWIDKKSGKTCYPSKLTYVVSVMGEGNYLLKIACDLYA